MQLRRSHAAGTAYSGDFFASCNFLSFFNKQPVVMSISRYPTVDMLNQNQVAKTFKFVAGIGDCTGICGLYISSQRCLNIYAVVFTAAA